MCVTIRQDRELNSFVSKKKKKKLPPWNMPIIKGYLQRDRWIVYPSNASVFLVAIENLKNIQPTLLQNYHQRAQHHIDRVDPKFLEHISERLMNESPNQAIQRYSYSLQRLYPTSECWQSWLSATFHPM